MKQYLELLQHVMTHGRPKGDRTGTGTRQVFGHQMRFDLSEGFPLVTTKKVHIKSIIAELLWFLSGSTNVKDLQAMGCAIWDEWAREDGSLGPVYGAQWRSWLTHTERREHTDERRNRTRTESVGYTVDQIAELVRNLKRNPNDRGHIVSAWNVGQLKQMALRPCHAMFQMDVTDGRLSCQLYQRSADLFLGVPFNIASYALLTHMVAAQCELAVGDFVWTGGDCHIYDNHVEQVQTQLAREPLPLPMLHIKRKPETIFEYRPDDFEFVGYQPHPAIKAPVAV